jgi:hypothetical protein
VEKQITSQYFPLVTLKDIRAQVRARHTTAVCVLSLMTASLINGQRPQSQQPFHAALDAQPNLTRAASFLWASAFTQCGDSLFFVRRGRANDIRLIEFKEPVAYDVQEDTLTRADQLNGLQAQGTAQFNASAARWIDNGVGSAGISPRIPQWSAWGGGAISGHPILTALGLVLTSLEISMTRKSGHWELSGENVDSFSEETVRNKITCVAAATANPLATLPSPSGSCISGDCSNAAPDPEPPRAGQFMCPGAELRPAGAPRGNNLKNYNVDQPTKILRAGITHVGSNIVETRIEVTGNLGHLGGWYVVIKGIPQDSCN